MYTPVLVKWNNISGANDNNGAPKNSKRANILIPFSPTIESTADIIKKKLKDVIVKNSAVSVKFEIFSPTIPSAIHVRPNQ